MREVVIVEYVRTPVGKRGGMLSGIRADELAAKPLKELINRSKISPEIIEDVIMGCVTQAGEQSFNIARIAALIADYPQKVPGTTIDRQCGSSQQAVHFAAQAIASGDMDVVVAGGIENMSREPMFSARNDVEFSNEYTSRYEFVHQGLSAEMIAEHWNITREELDVFSLNSHKKALKAQKEGKFKNEIMPISIKGDNGSVITKQDDEGPRSDTNLNKLSNLKPVFKDNGIVTAGQASQISDGASAILLMSLEKAKELNLKPKFKIIARSVVGDSPEYNLTAPIPATKDVLKKANLEIDDIDIYEVNEAFASVPLAWLKELGADENKLNVNGGAIALGHPLGASGGRLMCTMMSEMERSKYKYGLQTMCEGLGMANATVLERIE